MSRKEYNKLVRSKTFEIIKQNGNEPHGSEINFNQERVKELFKEKLKEEIEELIEARSSDEIIEEAADVIQVIRDYLRIFDYSPLDLEAVRSAKEIKRGTFFNHHNHALYLKHVDNK